MRSVRSATAASETHASHPYARSQTKTPSHPASSASRASPASVRGSISGNVTPNRMCCIPLCAYSVFSRSELTLRHSRPSRPPRFNLCLLLGTQWPAHDRRPRRRQITDLRRDVLHPPCRARLGHGADMRTLGIPVLPTSPATQRNIEAIQRATLPRDQRAHRPHVVGCQVVPLAIISGPIDAAAVPLRRAQHGLLVRPTTTDPERDARLLHRPGQERYFLDTVVRAVVAERLTAP